MHIEPQTRIAIAAVTILIWFTGGGRAADLPHGHPDFDPSPERPAGLQGDGTGHFPGATVVTKGDFRTGENIIWRAKMPNWGYSSPIVVATS